MPQCHRPARTPAADISRRLKQRRRAALTRRCSTSTAGETGWLGYEIEPHDGLHVVADRVQVQVARCGKPEEPAASGELGEVIVTSLMPASRRSFAIAFRTRPPSI